MAILGALLFIAVAGGLGWAVFYVIQQNSKIKAVSAENARLQAHAATVEAENHRLAPYTVVPDANAEAARIIAEANQKAEAKTAEIKSYGDQVTQWAQNLIQHAQAGEALSRQKQAALESVATAMRNMIEGYGNQYLVPPSSLLDDLANAFGFAEAGEKLKQARALTRSMVKENKAVTSGYPEKQLRVAASNFVLDAFNGKVDTTLASVKAQNVGILEQKMRDAFTLINNYGRSLGDTRITQAYLKARLAELKWAATAQQLRLDAQEEQRRLKEQIREEEKARFEAEKEQREAEQSQAEAIRKQEALRAELEKAKYEATQEANEEQRIAYEQKMRGMEAQIQDLEIYRLAAEEKKRRAIERAQTKKGHVYIISNVGSFGENVFKIGYTRRKPQDRVDELGGASVPFEFDLHAEIETDDAIALERRLHDHFLLDRLNKENRRKEFFRFDLKTLREDIEKMGFNVTWTMVAKAEQYQASLLTNQRLQNEPAFREEWIKNQKRLNQIAPSQDLKSDEDDSEENVEDSQ